MLVRAGALAVTDDWRTLLALRTAAGLRTLVWRLLLAVRTVVERVVDRDPLDTERMLAVLATARPEELVRPLLMVERPLRPEGVP
ncbi:MAG TPA: hypothetical protein DCR93_23680 [Cytophagales bacterium]|nr:hypothetical protein [Cytophagales bacterium]